MQKQVFTVAAMVLVLLMGCFSKSEAQTQPQNITATILQLDSLFWVTYNQCDLERMKPLIAEDMEFYHDKGGITLGQDGLLASIKNNLCGNENYRVRREEVKETIKVYPLAKGNEIYGAIISGDHLFYTKEKDKKEQLSGLAKFSNLWLLKDGTWKMARVLSYDHGPAPYRNTRNAISLPAKSLNQFIGEYTAPKAGKLTIQKENNSLILLSKGQKMGLHPETNNRFFVRERDLTFEFIKNKEASKMVVRENGEVVEEAVLLRK